MSERCDAIGEANEYCAIRVQCERPKGHEGPHLAHIGDLSRRIWQDVTFPMNFVEKPPSASK